MLTPPTAPRRPRGGREVEVKKREVKFYLDPPDEEALHHYCKDRGIDVSTLVRKLVLAHLKREGAGARPQAVELTR